MLRAMRNDFKKYSWTLWLVIFAFVGGFIVTDAFRGNSQAKTGLIFIGGKPVIQAQEYEQRLADALQRYKERLKENFNKSMVTQLGIPEQLLREMITNIIIEKEANNLNINASTDEVQAKLVSIPAFQQDGRFIGAKKYKQFLSYQKINVTEFEEQLKQEIIGEKLKELVSGSLVINPSYLEDQYKKEKDQAEVDFITLKPDRVKAEIKAEDSELTGYYEKNKESFKSREQRAAYIIAYNFADYQKEVKVTPQKVFDNFKSNKDQFRIPGKIKVSRILLSYGEKDRDEVYKKAVELQKNLTKENFADMAKANSNDEKAELGGDYGYMGWKNFTRQEVSIIESLDQDQISTPIDTLKGFSIVYIPEKVAERQQTFNEVKDKIEESLKQDSVKQYVTEQLQKVYNKLGKSDDISAKAKELGYTVTETQLLTNGQAVKDIDEMGYISRRMFTLNEKEIAFPVQFAQGIAIVQISKIEEPKVEPFEKVKEQVRDKVITAKKLDLLKSEAALIANQLIQMTDEKKIEEFLKKEELTPSSVTYKRGNRLSGFPVVKGLDDQVFSMVENKYSEPLVFDSQIVIYKVKSKKITSDEEFEKNKVEYYTQQTNQLQNTYFYSYINDKMQVYKVSQNQELFTSSKERVLARIN